MFMSDHQLAQQIMFGIFRLLSGISATFYSSAVVLGIEMVGPSHRATAGSIFNYFYVFGELINIGVAYVLRDFRYHYAAVSFIMLLLCVSLFFISESPRYLIVNGRVDEASKLFRRIAKSTNRTRELDEFNRVNEKLLLSLEAKRQSDLKNKKKNYSFVASLKVFGKRLIQSKILFLQAATTMINW